MSAQVTYGDNRVNLKNINTGVWYRGCRATRGSYIDRTDSKSWTDVVTAATK